MWLNRAEDSTFIKALIKYVILSVRLILICRCSILVLKLYEKPELELQDAQCSHVQIQCAHCCQCSVLDSDHCVH